MVLEKTQYGTGKNPVWYWKMPSMVLEKTRIVLENTSPVARPGAGGSLDRVEAISTIVNEIATQ
jgi:hypothetical protein